MRKKGFQSSVNHSLATSREKRDRLKELGENYASIDFEFTDVINEFNYKDKSIPVGTLKIGSKQVDITTAECKRIISTLEEVLTTHQKKIKLGLY
tara:strand:+ start:1957 stop:2241 length:285 start_codon:yes stop_codon:yes gene_type:complete